MTTSGTSYETHPLSLLDANHDQHSAEGFNASHGNRVLAGAIAILSQGEDLLQALGDETYTRRIPAVFNASIGGHYRHCLDHFSSFLRGVDAGFIDYDHRERDLRIEQDPDFALVITRQLLARLRELSDEDLRTSVAARCEVSYEHGDSPVTYSSFGRELVYAIAHAIHHYALISVMAKLMNAELPAHFGVAPSTVNHRKSTGTQ